MNIAKYKNLDFLNDDVMNTLHYSQERKKRADVINNITKGELVSAFRCDFGHKNGAEIHVVYSNGIVSIYNAKTKKHVTDLIARPMQIKRYYMAIGKVCPKHLINVANMHEKMGLNLQ